MKITENTLLPISLIICIILVTMWIADLRGDCTESTTRIDKLEDLSGQTENKIDKMSVQLSRIEAQIEIISEAVLPKKRFK